MSQIDPLTTELDEDLKGSISDFFQSAFSRNQTLAELPEQFYEGLLDPAQLRDVQYDWGNLQIARTSGRGTLHILFPNRFAELLTGLATVKLLHDWGIPAQMNLFYSGQKVSSLRPKDQFLVFTTHSGFPTDSLAIGRGLIIPARHEFELTVQPRRQKHAFDGQSNEIEVAAEIISNLARTISRRTDALEPIRISYSSLETTEVGSVPTVRLKGHVKSSDKKFVTRLPELVERTIAAITILYDFKHTFKIIRSFDAITADEAVSQKVQEYAVGVVGELNVTLLDFPGQAFHTLTRQLRGERGSILYAGCNANATRYDDFKPSLLNSIEVLARFISDFVQPQKVSAH